MTSTTRVLRLVVVPLLVLSTLVGCGATPTDQTNEITALRDQISTLDGKLTKQIADANDVANRGLGALNGRLIKVEESMGSTTLDDLKQGVDDLKTRVAGNRREIDSLLQVKASLRKLEDLLKSSFEQLRQRFGDLGGLFQGMGENIATEQAARATTPDA